MTVAAADVREPVQAPAAVVRPRRRWGVIALGAFTWLVIIYSIAPIGVMVAYSFNQATAGGKLTFSWLGFTTDAYRYVFAISDLTQALVHSLEVATIATVGAVLLGTPLALALARYRFYGKTLTDLTIFVDIAAPSIVVGASLLSLFISLNWPRDLTTIIIAHIAFDVAFVAVVVRARIAELDRSIEKASYDLGAGPWTTFARVTLPLIWPGIVAGALLAFVLSIDDFIITSFVAGQTLTFPLWVYGAVKTGIPPQVFAMGTLIFAGGIVLAVLNALSQRRRPA
jgi:spermidine/putrescine transport system permease protein